MPHVHRGDEHRQRPVHQCPADEDIDVVQPVFHHRQADRDRNGKAETERKRPAGDTVPERPIDDTDGVPHQDQGEGPRGDIGEPAQLAPLAIARMAEADDHGIQDQDKKQERPLPRSRLIRL
jgi:hypothetical protein